MLFIYGIAIIGFLGILFGFGAILYVNRFVKSEHADHSWARLRIIVLLTGLIIGILSWPATGLMGYSLSSNGQTFRVVGIPFMVAYFDINGHDYVGPIAFPSLIGNVVFWFLLPHSFFAMITKYRKRNMHTP